MFISNRRDGASPDDFKLNSSLAGQELEADKCLLKIIQTACKAENLHAAFDATLLLNQAQSLVAAGKIAAFFRLPALEERIIRAQEEKAVTREEREHNQRELKWAHRVDERVIPTRHASAYGSGAFSGQSPAPEATPQRSHHAPFRTRVPPSAPSSREARRRLVIEQSARDIGGSDGVEDGDEEMVYDSNDENASSSPQKRSRSEDAQDDGDGDEHEFVDEPETIMAPPPLSTAPKSKGAPFFLHRTLSALTLLSHSQPVQEAGRGPEAPSQGRVREPVRRQGRHQGKGREAYQLVLRPRRRARPEGCVFLQS